MLRDCTTSARERPNSQNHCQIDWSAPATNLPPHLLRESASWITKQRNIAFEDPSAAARQQRHHPVNLTALNTKQRLAYDIVAHHYHNFNNHMSTEPLHMVITGTARTGQSYLINALAELLGHQYILTGTTGMAGFNIQGSTLQSALQLPVQNHNNGGKAWPGMSVILGLRSC